MLLKKQLEVWNPNSANKDYYTTVTLKAFIHTFFFLGPSSPKPNAFDLTGLTRRLLVPLPLQLPPGTPSELLTMLLMPPCSLSSSSGTFCSRTASPRPWRTSGCPWPFCLGLPCPEGRRCLDFLWEPTKSKSNVNSETYENERWCQFSGSYLKEQFRLEKGLKLDPDKKGAKKF